VCGAYNGVLLVKAKVDRATPGLWYKKVHFYRILRVLRFAFYTAIFTSPVLIGANLVLPVALLHLLTAYVQ